MCCKLDNPGHRALSQEPVISEAAGDEGEPSDEATGAEPEEEVSDIVMFSSHSIVLMVSVVLLSREASSCVGIKFMP